MAKILIVDDEPRIRELIREHLQYAGYVCEEAGDGSAALSLLSGGGFDLVILDVMMPFMDGMTCLREMRARHINTPVIILTARGEEYDKLAGLEGGADDYVVKPFSVRELMLRVRAVLRRRKRPENGPVERHGIRLDPEAHRVISEGKEVALTATEFRLLEDLMRHAGAVRSREQLLDNVWGYTFEGYARTVDTHMRRLRSKLGESQKFLETVRGVGYRFNKEA